MADVLITGGRIVTAVDDYIADLLIQDGKIEAIGRELTAPSAVKHDATGLLVMPGSVDVHTHMEFTLGAAETCDTFETKTKSAAFGGTTTIVDFALLNWLKFPSTLCISQQKRRWMRWWKPAITAFLPLLKPAPLPVLDDRGI